MGADNEGSATGMSRATKLKVEDPPAEDGGWAGIPSLSLQQLWFSIQRREWSSLVAVPGDRDMSVMDFVKRL